MKEKNRFGSMLKHLMTVAKLKNYTLAKGLQYDESYISKWITGSLMPTEKNHGKILRDISSCVVNALDEDGWQTLMEEYQLERRSELELAIYDNLEAEYNYVMTLKESTGSEVAPATIYYPELTLAQFLEKMHHPVLRKVKDQEVIAVMDILALDRQYQMALAMLNDSKAIASRNYPGVSFSMLLNLETKGRDTVYNVSFLVHMLSSLSDLNFELYHWPKAAGKLVFAVKDAYSISGMIVDENHCLSVTTSEDIKNCNEIYDRLYSLCSREMLIVQKVKMSNMIHNGTYLQALFARNQRWMLSRLTEHFVPDALVDTFAQRYCQEDPGLDMQELQKAYQFAGNILRKGDVRILFFEEDIMNFAVTGIMDFFGRRIVLSPEERLICLEQLSKLVDQGDKVEVKVMKSGNFFGNHQNPGTNMFLSDAWCYLRMQRSGPVKNISLVNKVLVADMFRNFFDAVWEGETYIAVTGREMLSEMLEYAMQMIRMQIQ